MEKLNKTWKVIILFFGPFAPGDSFAGRKVVEMAAYEAALIYNEGNKAKSKVLQLLNIVSGKHFKKRSKFYMLKSL